MRHLRTVQVAIDQLVLLDAGTELHAISVRLIELALRAEPTPRNMED
jgi:hypothetical protein